MDVIRYKVCARSEPLERTMFACFPDPKLQEIGMEQVGQVLRESLVVATYAKKDPRVREFFKPRSTPDIVLWHFSMKVSFSK